MESNTKGLLLALTGFAIFSTHDVLVKFLGALYSPYQVLFFSVLFAFPLISFMLVHDSAARTMRPVHPWWTALRTASVIISTICIFYAFSALPLTQTYAILFTVPIQITLLSIPLLGERIGAHRGGAILVGFIGVLIVVQPGGADFTTGHLVGLIGAFFISLGSVIVRRIGPDERDLVLLLFPMLGSFVVFGALMPFDYRPMPLGHIGMVALLSLLSFIALNCMIWAYKAAEAAIVAPMQYSQILWASIFGVLFFDESPDRYTVLGSIVIILSGVYIVIRESRKDISQNTPVLRTRSRVTAGLNFRIGPRLRTGKTKKSNDI